MVSVPRQLAETCGQVPGHAAWLERLPGAIQQLQDRWSLSLGAPFSDASSAWVAPVVRADNTRAVLKLGMPHFEATHEIQGLALLGRWPDGAPARGR
jgi:hypothetical protein